MTRASTPHTTLAAARSGLVRRFLTPGPIPVLLGLALAFPTAAVAQSRGFVSVNGGVQATSNDFSDHVGFTLFAESGDFDAGYGIDSGALFDVSGGARVAGDFGIGVGISRFDKDGVADVSASLPHPFFFDQPRSVSGTSPPLQRTETAVHVLALYIVPVGSNLDVTVFGGPSFFSVDQEVVTRVQRSESYPYDTAAFAGTSVAKSSENAVGFNVGVDVGAFITRNIGVGVLLRFSRASVDLETAPGSTVSVDVGGFQTGGGLRLRF